MSVIKVSKAQYYRSASNFFCLLCFHAKLFNWSWWNFAHKHVVWVIEKDIGYKYFIPEECACRKPLAKLAAINFYAGQLRLYQAQKNRNNIIFCIVSVLYIFVFPRCSYLCGEKRWRALRGSQTRDCVATLFCGRQSGACLLPLDLQQFWGANRTATKVSNMLLWDNLLYLLVK